VVACLLSTAQCPVDGAEAVQCVHLCLVVAEVTGGAKGVLVQCLRLTVAAAHAQMPVQDS
jgi:hypothetical protein